MNLIKLLAPIAVFLGLTAGCDVINPDETIPTYIQIDSFRFDSNGDTFGSNSHKLSSVWVYFNSEPLGAFEMPARIPIRADQKGLVTIAPGIDFNGMKSFKAPYPFYRFDSLILEPMPGKVIQFDASTAYVNGARLAFHANFDLGNPFERFGGDTALTMTQDPEYVHEGTGSGYIYLDGPFKYSENVSLDPFRPSLSGPVYLEVNYKCNIPFQIGAVAFYSNGTESYDYAGGVNKSTEWNKIYISLQDFVAANQGAQLHLLIRAGTDDGEPNGWIAIDNIKIVSF